MRNLKKYLYTQVTCKKFVLKKIHTDIEERKGFNFTEIEDSNYHDMKSVIILSILTIRAGRYHT